jgi:hypothetical protein
MDFVVLRARSAALRRTLTTVAKAAAGAAWALLLASEAAHAACSPASPVNNANVTCSGATTNQNTPNGFGSAGDNGNTITVTPGATVTGTTSGITFNTGTVSSSGTIAGANFGIGASGPTTVTNSGTITGDRAVSSTTSVTVTNSGAITGVSRGVVEPGVGPVIVTNSGTITATAAAGEAVAAIGPVTLTNSGTITAPFFAVIGVGNAPVTLTNSGTITSANITILANLGTATVTNSGNISGVSQGVSAFLAATVTNTGSISASSPAGGQGIGTFGVASVNNSGLISGGTHGIFAQSVNVTNSGTISGAHGITLALGIGSSTAGSILVNSGAIIGTGGTAIDFGISQADSLTFLPGSRVTGLINLGAHDAVNFVGGGNWAYTFGAPNSPGTATINAGGAPFVVAGNVVAVLDPTPFGFADKNLMDFTRGVSGILGTLGGAGAAPNGPISAAFAPSDGGGIAARVDDAFAAIPALAYAGRDGMVFKNPTMVTAEGRSVWARGFGGEHVQDADGPMLRARTTFVGGAVGFDMVARPDLRLGAFVGGGQSRLAIDLNAGSTNTDTGFAGVYGRWGFASFGAASFLDFALHGGGSSNSTTRTINSNVAPGGLEIATASYSSGYVSPELKYGIDVPLGARYTLTPSAQVRYVAGFFGGYTESGSSANFTVGSRTIQDIEERGELKLTRTMMVGGDLLLASGHVGVLGIERLGDTTVNTVLLGANLPFVTPGRNSVAGAVGGGGLEWRTRAGVSLFSAAEYIAMSDSSHNVTAMGGVRVAF